MRKAKRGEIVPLHDVEEGHVGYWIRGHIEPKAFRAALRSYLLGDSMPRGKPIKEWWRVVSGICVIAEPRARGTFAVTVLYTGLP